MCGKLSDVLSSKDHESEMARRTRNHRLKWENAIEQPREPTDRAETWFIPSSRCLATLIEHLALSVTEQRLSLKYELVP